MFILLTVPSRPEFLFSAHDTFTKYLPIIQHSARLRQREKKQTKILRVEISAKAPLNY